MSLRLAFLFVSAVCYGYSINISVSNFDFEAEGELDGQASNTPGVIPSGWTEISGGEIPGNFFGYFNPLEGNYFGTDGSGTNGTMSGPNVFFFGEAETGDGIEQTLGDTFLTNVDYSVTVAIGARKGGSMNDLGIEFLAGSTTLISETVSNHGSLGNFVDTTVTYSANPANDSLLGQALTVRFFEVENGGNEADIDNVRVSYTVIPEPSSFALCFGLLIGLGAIARRRN